MKYADKWVVLFIFFFFLHSKYLVFATARGLHTLYSSRDNPKKKINVSPIQYFSDLKVWWAGAMKRVKQKKQAPKGQP